MSASEPAPRAAGTPVATAASHPSPFQLPGTAWDKCAKRYAEEAPRMTGGHALRALDRVLSLLGASSERRVAIADIACGSGVLTTAAAQKPEVESVIASDYSTEMCAVVDRSVQALGSGVTGSVRTLVADAQDLSGIPTASVDATFCVFALMMVPDPAKAAAEMVRITKPGGLIAIVNWAPARSQFHGWMASLNKFIAAKNAAAAASAEASTAANILTRIPTIPFGTIESHEELFQRLGLEKVAIDHFTSPSRTYEDAMDYWLSMQQVAPMFHKRSEQDTQWMLEYVNSIWGAQATFNLQGTSIVAIARKPL